MKQDHDLPLGWSGDSYIENPWGNQEAVPPKIPEQISPTVSDTNAVSQQMQVPPSADMPAQNAVFDTLKKKASAAKSAAQDKISEAKEKIPVPIQNDADTAVDHASNISEPVPASKPVNQLHTEKSVEDEHTDDTFAVTDAPVPLVMRASDYPAPESERLSPAVIIIPICFVVIAFGGGLLYAKSAHSQPPESQTNVSSASASEPAVTSAADPPDATDFVPEAEQQETSLPDTQELSEDVTMEALRAYAEVLRAYMHSDTYVYDTEYDEVPMYDLCDINQDGIPELVISHGESHAAGYCDLYAYVKGECVYLDMHGQYGYMRVIPAQHMIEDFSGGMGYFYHSYYDFDGEKLTQLDTFFDNTAGVLDGEEVVYQHNEQDVSKAEYEAARAEYDAYEWETQSVGRAYMFPDSLDDWEYVGYQKIQ